MRTEEERRARRVERIERMRRRRSRNRGELPYRWGILAVVILVISVAVGFGVGTVAFSHRGGQRAEENSENREILENEDSDGQLALGNGEVESQTASEDGTAESEETIGDGASESEGIIGDGVSGNEEAAGDGSGEYAGTEGEGELAANQRPAEDDGEDAEGQDKQEEIRFTKSIHMPEQELSLLRSSIGGKTTTYARKPEPVQVRPQLDPEIVAASASLGNPYMIPNRIFQAQAVPETDGFDEEIISKYGVFIDVESGTVLAQKDAWERMNPASMTKILTVLVAAEHLTRADLDETVPITIDITDYCYSNECSITGYELNEEVPVRDLFYGTVLPSGGDSALALAIYVAGSHEAFVDMMNAKLVELGLAETSHFTNCVGLYDQEHYTTAYDLAVILMEAVKNEFCRDVLSAHTYRTTSTVQHPEGLLISNWFLRRIEDRDTHGEVLCAKTGYVDESGSCAASLGTDYNGREYICVTARSTSSWNCIADHVILYQKYLPELPSEE